MGILMLQTEVQSGWFRITGSRSEDPPPRIQLPGFTLRFPSGGGFPPHPSPCTPIHYTVLTGRELLTARRPTADWGSCLRMHTLDTASGRDRSSLSRLIGWNTNNSYCSLQGEISYFHLIKKGYIFMNFIVKPASFDQYKGVNRLVSLNHRCNNSFCQIRTQFLSYCLLHVWSRFEGSPDLSLKYM